MHPTTTTATTTASPHYREGNSDKVYQAAIEPKDDGYIVTYAYGRRGTTLTTGTKTSAPVPLATATGIFDKLVSAKLAKGYTPSEDGTPYRQTGDEGRDSGVRCQLLNPVEESDLARLLTDSRHCLQQKHDGRRMLVRKQGDHITGINRRGLLVALPDPIRHAVAELPYDVLIDGEAVGDTLHAFDLLEVKGNDLRARRYIDRFAGLISLIPPGQPALRWVSTAISPDDKVGILTTDVPAPTRSWQTPPFLNCQMEIVLGTPEPGSVLSMATPKPKPIRLVGRRSKVACSGRENRLPRPSRKPRKAANRLSRLIAR
jgi:bifunctional non-homologous end joining protein LigD